MLLTKRPEMKTHLKILLNLATFAFLSLAAVRAADAPVPAAPAEHEDGGGRGERGEAGRARLQKRLQERMTKELGLTADQEAKIKVLHEDEKKAAETIFANTALTRDQKRDQRMALRKSTESQVDAILTPEQQKKAAELRAKVGEKMRERGDRRGQHPGTDAEPGKN